MKKLFAVLALLSLSSVHAVVTTYSNTKIMSGYVDGISVRTDLKEVTLLIRCAGEKALIKYSNEDFKTGLELSGAIGRFYSVGMSRAIINNQIMIEQYQLTATQEALPGEVICK